MFRVNTSETASNINRLTGGDGGLYPRDVGEFTVQTNLFSHGSRNDLIVYPHGTAAQCFPRKFSGRMDRSLLEETARGVAGARNACGKPRGAFSHPGFGLGTAYNYRLLVGLRRIVAHCLSNFYLFSHAAVIQIMILQSTGS